MARLETKLEIKTGNGDADYLCSMADNYSEAYRTLAKIDNSDTFTSLASLSKVNTSILKGSKVIVIKNNSKVGVELRFLINEFGNSLNHDNYVEDLYISQYLAGGEYMLLPNQFMFGYNAVNSGGNANTVNNQGGYDVDTTLAEDSGADNDSATEDAMTDDTSAVIVYLEWTSAVNNHANYFVVGDLIRLDDEIMEVTGKGDVTDLANTFLNVKRGVHGSTVAVHADDVAVELPYFNTQGNFDDYAYAQTNASGIYTATNFLSFGREATTAYPTGIVRGSIALKFYNSGYQELNLTGITPSTHSGLAASTEYKFNITADGGSVFANLAFTTDASNLNFGGNNGIIGKIQAALDAQFYTAGNLFQKKVSVGIVNGDVRFTSQDRTRASAILLAAPGSGTTPFGVGRLPAIAAVEPAIAALLPDDTIFAKDTNIETSNVPAFAYDDGKGNIIGAASGSINYQTGAIRFNGPANAEFVASLNHGSVLSGGITTDSNLENGITSIVARSCNSKINAEIELIGFV